MNAMPRTPVCAARIWSSNPIRLAASRPAPRMSIACPPVRGAGARSTTVTLKPYRRSQYARAGPATLAPEIRTLVFFIVALSRGGSSYDVQTVGRTPYQTQVN